MSTHVFKSLSRSRVICIALAMAAGSGAAVHAEGAAPPLGCAVEAAPSSAQDALHLCSKLARELGRSIRAVDDARQIRRGQGVQVITTDVTWYVVLLEAGRVRAFTRISVTEARGREVQFVARAVRALLRTKPSAPSACLRIDPNSPEPSSDVVYPWAELAPCTRTVLDVRDPWWVPVQPSG